MFTFLKPKADQNPMFFINDKPVYTQFKKDDKQRIPPFKDSNNFLESEEFREHYNLTRTEGKVLKKALHSDIVPEGKFLKEKFYKIRKDLNNRLYNELDLRGTDKSISWKYPPNPKEWAGTIICIGSSNSGKTFLVASHCEEALRRKKKRKFIYMSPEFAEDRTLQKLRNNKRWMKYFTGIDVSDRAFKDSEKGSPQQWWDEVIFPKLEAAEEGTVIIMDDNKDSEVWRQSRTFMNKYMRTGRHKKVGLVSIQHEVRGSQDTAQAYSSVKTVILFPRAGGKGKQVDFLHEMTGVTLRRAHELVEIFAESGRWMSIHSWSPVVLYGPKYAVWV